MAFAISPTTPLFLDFIDKNGRHASVVYYLLGLVVDPLATAPAVLGAATAALTPLVLVTQEVAPFAMEGTAVTPDTTSYDRVQDKLLLKYGCVDGSRVKVELPTFKSTDLAPDSIGVSTTDTDMLAVVNYIKANCCSADGVAINKYVGGYKMRPSGQKKH